MGVFQAYFDESGKLADKPFVVFAGCVAEISDWESFSNKWNDMLGTDIRFVHMTEAMGCSGEFKQFRGREHDRDDLLVALVEMGFSRYAFSFYLPIDSAIFSSLNEGLKGLLKDPVYCGFEGMARNLIASANHIQAESGRQYSHAFQLYCDSSEQYSLQILKLYHRLRSQNKDMRDRFQCLTFAEDQHFPPLQLADVIAYCRRRQVSNQLNQPVLNKIIEVLDRGIPSAGDLELVYEAHSRGLGHGTVEMA